MGQIKDAIQGGRGVRVTLWNMTAKREGFWNCLAIYPDHHNRYFLSVQAGPASIGVQPATLSLYDGALHPERCTQIVTGALDLAIASHYVRLEPLVACCVVIIARRSQPLSDAWFAGAPHP